MPPPEPPRLEEKKDEKGGLIWDFLEDNVPDHSSLRLLL